jgi:hypothetical protein
LVSVGQRPGPLQDQAALKLSHAREALKRVAAGEPLREIALSYNVDHSTISRLAQGAARCAGLIERGVFCRAWKFRARVAGSTPAHDRRIFGAADGRPGPLCFGALRPACPK